MESPFDPEEFEPKFTAALEGLCDPSTEIDCVFNEGRTLALYMTVDGVDFELTIAPQTD